MTDMDLESIEALRKKVHEILASLSPREAQALRAMMNMKLANQSRDEEGTILKALLDELVISKLKKQ